MTELITLNCYLVGLIHQFMQAVISTVHLTKLFDSDSDHGAMSSGTHIPLCHHNMHNRPLCIQMFAHLALYIWWANMEQ